MKFTMNRITLSLILALVAGGVILGVTRLRLPNGETTARQVGEMAVSSVLRQAQDYGGPRESGDVADIVERSSGAVVSVADLSSLRQSPEDAAASFVGTGFVVGEGKGVFTAAHVLARKNANYVILTSSGTQLEVEKTLLDESHDVALLVLKDSYSSFLNLGDSESLRVGEELIAIGNAYGRYTNTVTTGVVSGIGRGVRASNGSSKVETLENVIQTDAALNPGSSGGPLLNKSGLVVAMATAVSEEGENIGFGVPSSVLKQAVESYESTGTLVRPSLGIKYTMITPTMAKAMGSVAGARVDEVEEGGSAQSAGVRKGDVVIAVDGEDISAERTLSDVMITKAVGDSFKMKVSRGGREVELEVTL